MIETQLDKLEKSTNFLAQTIISFLEKCGVDSPWSYYLNAAILTVLLFGVSWVVQILAKRVVTVFVKKSSKISKFKILRYLLENKFAHAVSQIIPCYLGRVIVPIIFDFTPTLVSILLICINLYLTVCFAWIFISISKGFGDLLRERSAFKDKPIDSFVQIFAIFVYFVAGIVFFSILLQLDVIDLLTRLGAISAVIMLIFKDAILGFVASIQVSANDMVRNGDWITMPKYNADGDVFKISLTTVKVRNFDKTIITIPTYALISDSFQNWRGMQAAGGRRIKRSISLKQASIRYITEDELPRFKQIQGISRYIDEKVEEIDKHNESISADRSLLINGRNLSNAGLFRKYVEWYLSTHPRISQHLTLMVRQLAPSSEGLPIEIYAFTNTTKWVDYEHIMADIFDHILASIVYFDLEIFEEFSARQLTITEGKEK